MPYCTQTQVESFSQENGDNIPVGDYATTLAYVISVADRAIDSECEVPEEFFEAGGVAVANEMHDGVELGYVPSWVENPYNLSAVQPLLRLKYKPIVGVTTVESKSSAGAWSTLTVNVDYVVDPLGIRFLTNMPRYSYGNIRVKYTAGYAATPAKISALSAQLSAAIIQRIVDSKWPRNTSGQLGPASVSGASVNLVGFAEACLQGTLREEVAKYRNMVPARVV